MINNSFKTIVPMRLLHAKFWGCIAFMLIVSADLHAQREVELKRCNYYRIWQNWSADTIAPDSFQFSVKDKADRFLLVDKLVNPKSGKLRRKDFGGFAFNVDGNYYAQHMYYTEYISDAKLLVRYHVFGLNSAYFIAINDPVIGLERHNYTGFGIIGDAIAESVKNSRDRSNKEWKSNDGRIFSIIYLGSTLDENGNMVLLNPSPVLLSENALNFLVNQYQMGSKYLNKPDWTAEEIGAFLTEINEAEGKSIVKFKSLDFSSTGE